MLLECQQVSLLSDCPLSCLGFMIVDYCWICLPVLAWRCFNVFLTCIYLALPYLNFLLLVYLSFFLLFICVTALCLSPVFTCVLPFMWVLALWENEQIKSGQHVWCRVEVWSEWKEVASGTKILVLAIGMYKEKAQVCWAIVQMMWTCCFD